MRNIYTSVLILLLAGFFASCDKDVKGPLYDEDEITGKTGNVVPKGATFQAVSFNHEMAAEDNEKIYVPVLRNSEEVSSVKVAFYNTYVIDKNSSGGDITEKRLENTFEAEDGNVFTLETPTVTFEAGKLTAYAIISYESVDNLDPTLSYATSLVVTEGNIGLNGIKETSMVVSRKLTFETIGTGYFVPPFGNFFNKDTLAKYPTGMVPMPIEKAEEGNIFRIVNPFGRLNPDNAGSDLVFVIQKELNSDGYHKVTYTSFATGYHMDEETICWAHFVPKYHAEYCHYSDDDPEELLVTLYGRFMNEEQTSGYKPGSPFIPDVWSYEYYVIMPSDYVYTE